MSSLVTSEGTSLGVLAQIPGVDALQVASPAGGVEQTLNLFRSDVNLALPLLNLSEPDGLGYAITAYLTSNVRRQADTWNQTAPTGYLGLGWSLSFDAILVDNPPAEAPSMYSFYLASGGGATRLHNVGTDSTGALLFEADAFEFWRIRYFPKDARWEITREDGSIYIYGGTPGADPATSALQLGVRWPSQEGNWTGPSVQSNGMVQMYTGFNLAEVRSPWGAFISFAYENDVRQLGSTAGLSYTASSRLRRMTDTRGTTVELQYGKKNPDEYQIPHVDPSGHLVAYQDRFETRYLDRIRVFGAPDGGTTPLLFTLEFGYQLATVGVGPGTDADLLKRYLTDVVIRDKDGRTTPGVRFTYLSTASDRKTGVNRGAVATVAYPTGAVSKYYYADRTLSGTELARAIEPGATPGVFWGPDYAVLVSHDDSAKLLTVEAWAWNGRWVSQRLLDKERVDFNPDTLVVAAQDGFFALAFRTSATREQLAVRKFARQKGTVAEFKADDRFTYLDIASGGNGVATAGASFVVAVATGSRPVVQVWDPANEQWIDRSSILNPSSRGQFALSAYGDSFAFADVDITRGEARLQAFAFDPVARDFKTFSLGRDRISPVFWTSSSPYTLLTMGPCALAVTWISAAGEEQFDVTLQVQQWNRLFRAQVVIDDIRRGISRSSPLAFTETHITASVVANVDRLWRFDGRDWVHAQMGGLTDDSHFAYGDDIAVRSGPNSNEVWLFDPYKLTWTQANPSGSSRLPCTASGNTITIGPDVYTRGPNGSLERLGSLDPNMKVGSLANRAPSFLAYEDQSGNTYVVPLDNGRLDSGATTKLPSEHIVTGQSVPGGGLVGGLALLTWMGSNFRNPKSVQLRQVHRGRVTGQLTHPVVTSTELNVGLDATGQTSDGRVRRTALAYDDGTVTVSADGETAEFGEAAVIVGLGGKDWVPSWPPPDATPRGQTRTTYHNNRSASEVGWPLEPAADDARLRLYAYLHGQIAEEQELTSTGALTRRRTWDYEVYTERTPLTGGKPVGVYGAWVRTVGSTTTLDYQETFVGSADDLQSLGDGSGPEGLRDALHRARVRMPRSRLQTDRTGRKWLVPDARGTQRFALRIDSGRLLVSVPVVQTEREVFSRQSGLAIQSAASYTNTSGEAREQVEDNIYAWQVPVYANALIETHQLATPCIQLQRDLPADNPTADGTLTAILLRTFRKWPDGGWGSFAEYQARTETVWRPGSPVPVEFAAWRPEDDPPPAMLWVATSRVQARAPSTGEVVQQTDAMGVPSTNLYDRTGSKVVATFQGAPANAVTYAGFERYEAAGPWEMSDRSPVSAHIVRGDAHTGTASLALAAGGPSVSAAFDWSKVDGPSLVAFWAKTSAAGAKCEVRVGGSVVATHDIGDTGGTWQYAWLPVAASGDLMDVKVRFVAGAGALLVDDVIVCPVHSDASANVYGAASAAIASVAPGGQCARLVRDGFAREVLHTNAAGSLVTLDFYFLSAQLGSFDAARPNVQTTWNPADSGTIADLYQGGAWRSDWSDTDGWEVHDGVLIRVTGGEATIAFTAGGDGADRGVRATVVLPTDANGLPIAPSAPVSIGLGASIIATWSPGIGWRLTVSGTGIAGLPGNTSLPAAELGLIATSPKSGTGFVGFYADGQLLAWTRANAVPGGRITLGCGNAGVGFRNIAVANRPSSTSVYTDGIGTERQQHVLSDTGTIAYQDIPDDVGETVITTKSVPVEGGAPAYNPGLVTAITWPSGVMEGIVARYYSANGQGSDDRGYPYSRVVTAPTPSRREIMRSMAGKDFAIIQDATGASTNPHTTAYAYQTNTQGEFGDDNFPDSTFHVQVTTDADGRVVQVCTDVLGRKVATKAGPATPGGTDYATVRLDLDAAGRTKKVYLPNALAATDPDGRFILTNTFDFLGNPISQSTPDTGTAERVFDLRGSERFMLDAVNAAKAPGQQVIRYAKFDPLARLVEEGSVTGTWNRAALQDIADDDPSWPRVQDGALVARTFNYDGDGAKPTDLGQIVAARTVSGRAAVSEELAWTLGGQLESATITTSAGTRRIALGYDGLGRPIHWSYPEGAAVPNVTYRYDRMGDVLSVGTPDDSAALATFTYDPGGSPLSRLSRSAGRRFERTWTYNSPGWETLIADREVSDQTGAPAMTETLTYTSGGAGGAGYYTGQIASVAVVRDVPDAPGAQTWAMASDGLSRTTIADGGQDVGFTYDLNGNIGTVTVDSEIRTFVYQDGTDRVSQVTTSDAVADSLAYDLDGRTLSSTARRVRQVVYDDVLARPISVDWADAGDRTLAFAYDSNGRRVWSQDEGGQASVAVYGEDPFPWAEALPDGTLRQYVFGPGGPIAVYDGNAPLVLWADHLGSVRWVGAADGSTVGAFDYKPYGGLANSQGTNIHRWTRRYTGKAQDPTGLYDFGARWYDTELGRFWTPDPEGQFASPYTYAGDRPFDAVDDDGELAFLIALAIAALAGAAIGGTVNLAMNWEGSSSGERAAYFFIGAGFGAVAATAGVGLAAATGGMSIGAAIAVSVVAEGALGAVEGYLSNGLNNTVAGKGFNEGAGLAALTGGLIGGAMGGFGAAASGLRQGLRQGGRARSALRDPRGRGGPARGRPRLSPSDRARQAARVGEPYRFRYHRNERGRRIWLSRYTTSWHDIYSIVRSAQRRGRRVTILSGTHGNTRGGLSAEPRFFGQDVETARYFGGRRNVEVVDVWSISERQMRRILNGRDEVIANFCFSRNNDDVRRALGLHRATLYDD
jgi:RHS repeat-associated protein